MTGRGTRGLGQRQAGREADGKAFCRGSRGRFRNGQPAPVWRGVQTVTRLLRKPIKWSPRQRKKTWPTENVKRRPMPTPMHECCATINQSIIPSDFPVFLFRLPKNKIDRSQIVVTSHFVLTCAKTFTGPFHSRTHQRADGLLN